MDTVTDHREQQPGDAALDDLLDAARAGAPWAFERLYEHLSPRVAGYLRFRGAADPDDLANEVMLTVFHGLGEFEGSGVQLRSWVFTIAHRRGVDEHRRRTRRPVTAPLEPHIEPAGGDVEQEALSHLGDERLHALLQELTDAQREVVLLRIVADLSVAEVAELLGKRPGAVKMLQRRALAQLRGLLEREGVTR